MPTETKENINIQPTEISYTEQESKISFFEKLKYLFSKFFEFIGNFFKNLFSYNKTTETVYKQPMQPITTDNVIKENKEKIEKENTEKNKTKNIDTKEKKINNDIIDNNEEEIHNNIPMLNPVSNNTVNGENTFIEENNTDIIENDESGVFEVPVLGINDVGDDVFDYNDENVAENKVKDKVVSEFDDIFEDEPIEIKTPKENFLNDIRKIDARAVSITSQKDTLTVLFELEDETNIIVDIAQNGDIKSLNKIISGFDAVVDDIGFNSTTKTTVPVTSAEIGFDSSLKGLTALMLSNPNIINEIYNSKNEIERREKQMLTDAKQVKINNIEELKDILLNYLETANRNLIMYDMQDKTLCIKLPTNDARDDTLMEMGREFVINLTDMSYHIKIETMDFSAHGGGYNTEIEKIDIDTMEAKFRAIYETTKANKDFFDKDLSTEGPVDEIEYEEYIEIEEDERPNRSNRDADRKKTQERNRAIKNKEFSRSGREDNVEKKSVKKQHFNPNRDEDDFDL